MIRKWPSPAKLNLFLYVIGNAYDGYHLLQTLFQFINYGDTIEVIPNNTGEIILFTSNTKILYQDNLIIKAAKLLQSYCWPAGKKVPGAIIILNKLLPIGSGLGGGSSNAATVLVALNYIWKTKLSLDILAKLGLLLGTDIPAFVYGKTSLVEGIGEILTPVLYPKKWYLVIILPIQIITKHMFGILQLKKSYPHSTLAQLLMKPFYNDFELIVRKTFPIVDQYFIYLQKYIPVRLTGTGSSVFAEFDSKVSAYRMQQILPFWMSTFIAQGINISPLHSCY